MTPEQLKASILQYAIQGKLVEQRQEEGTAEELYLKIQEEKQKLIKEGKIKKEKLLPEITDDEIPFEIPESWKWVRWGDISQKIQYGYNAPTKHKGKIKIVRISDIQNDIVLWDQVPYCDIAENEIETYLLKENDILFARTGGTVGKSLLVSDLPENVIYAGYLIRTSYSDNLDPKYIKFFMGTGLYWNQLNSGTIATAQPNCNGQTLSKMIVPLPPLAEQHRIASKIEQLLPLIDRYASSYEKLARFNTKFPEDMKKSILQYAIQGKLVEQRPEEGTAEELYQKIQEDKRKRLNGKKESKLPSEIIKEDDIPYNIPESWKWVRFGFIMINRDAERIPLSVSERQNLSKIYDYYGASGVIDKVDRFLFDEKLLLIGEDGANLLARSTPIAFLAEGKYWVNNHAHVLDCNRNLLCMEYIMYYINAITLAPYVTGTAQPKMNQEKMNSIPIALPPYEEQIRIVKKIEELLPYCDQLIK